MIVPDSKSLFLAYNFADEAFVERVARYLRTQQRDPRTQRPGLETYFYRFDAEAGPWNEQIMKALEAALCCVAIVGAEIGAVQRRELDCARTKQRILVTLPTWTESCRHEFFEGLEAVRVRALGEAGAFECAQTIARYLRHEWLATDDVPPGYPFEYEKSIIGMFRAERRRRAAPSEFEPGQVASKSKRTEAQRAHVPVDWPEVFRWPMSEVRERPNPVSADTIGAFREHTDRILVDSRARPAEAPRADGSDASEPNDVFLPEAGPRKSVVLPTRTRLKVGILVSGGIAPGINAVISGIFHRHELYADPPEGKRNPLSADDRYDDLTVVGFLEGFEALSDPSATKEPFITLTRELVDEHAHEGGSLISTSRYDALRDKPPEERQRLLETAVRTLAAQDIRILYVIGGDGSMRAAHAIFTTGRRLGERISVVGIPKTMDNDILWVWQSFGFLSAVEKAREAILNLQTEVRSNPRLCVVQLFGSDSGFVVAHTVLGTGQCDYALVPEVGFTMATLCKYMTSKLRERKKKDKKAHGMIVMAETAIPRDVENYLDLPELGLSDAEKRAVRRLVAGDAAPGAAGLEWRVPGQTPDELRTAGVKIVAGVLKKHIREEPMGERDPYWKRFRVVTNEPRHILRSAPPSVQDVIFGQRLGALAVDNALAGYSDFMISQWNTEFVLVPLQLVVLGRKRLPPDGIFWKSVLASTGQPVESELP